MMASSKGSGLPRRMLLVMFVFTLLLVQHAQGQVDGDSCEVGKDAAAKVEKGCSSGPTKLKCDQDPVASPPVDPPVGKCRCTTPAVWKGKECLGGAGAGGSPATTVGSKGTGSESSAVRVRAFIPSVLAGLFLGVGVLSTF